jgi:[ribosomal protein S18]-alanine N-acetyltransferase
VELRRVESRDVEAILAIQTECPEVAQWTMWDYERVARGEMAGWVAEDAGQVVGFLIARQVANDIEILNLALRPEARRRLVGTALLKSAIDWGRMFHAENALLEVRASNLAAVEFYEKHGFQATGRRPRYYAAPVDDALVLTAKIG